MVSSRAIAVCLIFFVLASCGSGGFEYKPTSAGKADEVLWVMNDGFWADTVGGTVNHSFQAAYGVMPQAEPEYFLRKKNFNQFNNDIIKKYRVIVICASKDVDLKYGYLRNLIDEAGQPYDNVVHLSNVWAQPQTVTIITADTKKELNEVLRTRSAPIKEFIRKEEDKGVHTLLYENEKNREATDLLSSKYGFSMDIPSGYYIAGDNEDFSWFRLETVVLSSNVMVYKRSLAEEVVDPKTDWAAYGRNIRNYLGNSYISSVVEGSYMEIEERFAPVLLDSVAILGQQGWRTQGLWRMEKDFMGGPFVNRCWYDAEEKNFYMIDFFVHAPKEGKKKYIRHLEYMYSTLSRE